MKKILVFATLMLGMSSCSLLAPPVTVNVQKDASMNVTNLGGKATVEVFAGDTARANAALRLIGDGKLSLTAKPSGTECYLLNDDTSIYCRLGTVGAGKGLAFGVSGKVSSGGFAYSSPGGGVAQVSAKIFNSP
jgi:hypothetical protein